ncbi:hypothetical protein [Streptomyces cyaneofuscatus]|uniref:hypothetical protein n=1 Tax=Streptomyces cyaneofuscatus TaxID=66883 RepID=UPI0033263EC2
MKPGVENDAGNSTPENPDTQNVQETLATSGDSQSTDAGSGNREAAKYRTKLREAEGKLEAAESRIAALVRKDIERHAAKRLSVGADLFDIGQASIDDLTDPGGDAMPDAIDAVIDALLDKRPGLGVANRPWGEVGGSSPAGRLERSTPTMHDALKNAKR